MRGLAYRFPLYFYSEGDYSGCLQIVDKMCLLFCLGITRFVVYCRETPDNVGIEQIAAQFKKFDIHGLVIVGGFEVYFTHSTVLPTFGINIVIFLTFCVTNIFCLLAAVALL